MQKQEKKHNQVQYMKSEGESKFHTNRAVTTKIFTQVPGIIMPRNIKWKWLEDRFLTSFFK